jgi:hypothetical protein
MDVFAVLSFLIMGTATLFGLSLLAGSVLLQRNPARPLPAALPRRPSHRCHWGRRNQEPSGRSPAVGRDQQS